MGPSANYLFYYGWIYLALAQNIESIAFMAIRFQLLFYSFSQSEEWRNVCKLIVAYSY